MRLVGVVATEMKTSGSRSLLLLLGMKAKHSFQEKLINEEQV
jgi:hypothetical protein